MICTSNRSKDFRSQIQHFEFQLTQYFSRKWSAPALISSYTKISILLQADYLKICENKIFTFCKKESPPSCSIFKLHPRTFSFSIISDIFQAIFINSNSYQINWENAKIHVCTEVKNKVYLFSLQLKDKCDPHGRFTTI